MKRDDYINWEQYFMGLVKLSAWRSKDPNTQVGCVVVGDNNKILTIGYNGFPRGCSDDLLPWSRQGVPFETKYNYVVHAEMNAILNSLNNDLRGGCLYVNLFPCNECAKVIIQTGIKTVVYLEDKYSDTDNVLSAKRMFKLANIEIRQYLPSNRTLQIDV